jgi:Cytochrome P460
LPSRSISLLLLGLLICAANAQVFGQSASSAEKPQSGSAYTLEYTKDGRLVPPARYREWIFVTSGFGMNYGPKASMDHEMFDNVFVNPEVYRSFLETGTWPDKTVLVLELRGAKGKGSINKNGHYQDTELMGVEAHVKDESRFPGKWAFFDIDNDGGTLLPQSASCYSCHAEHAAVDTTFVQFYPTLLPTAQKKATLSPAYLKEMDLPSE